MTHPYQCYYEITQQPEALEECVSVFSLKRREIQAFFQATQPDQILFVGCTSPYYIGKSVAYFWQSALGIPVQVVTSSELVQFPEGCFSPSAKRPLLVAISRSGKTSETIWAAEMFERKFPGRTVLIGCQADSPLANLASLKMILPKGMEETLAQTRSFSTMYLAAQMMCAAISRQEDILATLATAPAVVKTVLAQIEPVVREIFERRDFSNLFFLGSGPLYGIALDAALKMMEMSLSEVMCYPFLESRHGPKSIIGQDSFVTGLFTHAGQGYEPSVIEEYSTRHQAVTVAVTPVSKWPTGNPVFHIPVGYDWPDSILGLLYLPVVQMMAYYRAVAKGVNPDESRNLTQYIKIP